MCLNFPSNSMANENTKDSNDISKEINERFLLFPADFVSIMIRLRMKVEPTYPALELIENENTEQLARAKKRQSFSIAIFSSSQIQFPLVDCTFRTQSTWVFHQSLSRMYDTKKHFGNLVSTDWEINRLESAVDNNQITMIRQATTQIKDVPTLRHFLFQSPAEWLVRPPLDELKFTRQLLRLDTS